MAKDVEYVILSGQDRVVQGHLGSKLKEHPSHPEMIEKDSLVKVDPLVALWGVPPQAEFPQQVKDAYSKASGGPDSAKADKEEKAEAAKADKVEAKEAKEAKHNNATSAPKGGLVSGATPGSTVKPAPASAKPHAAKK
jgi:hypothetical protein